MRTGAHVRTYRAPRRLQRYLGLNSVPHPEIATSLPGSLSCSCSLSSLYYLVKRVFYYLHYLIRNDACAGMRQPAPGVVVRLNGGTRATRRADERGACLSGHGVNVDANQ